MIQTDTILKYNFNSVEIPIILTSNEILLQKSIRYLTVLTNNWNFIL